MKFKELENKLNEIIEKEDLSKSNTFDSKEDIKRWIEERVIELVGSELITKRWSDDQKTKYRVEYDYSGKVNYVDIRKDGYWVLTINFKYSRESHYEHWWTRTTYGVKSVSIDVNDDYKSDNFVDCVSEIEKRKAKDNESHLKHLEERYNKIKAFMDKTGLTLDELDEILSEIKYVDYNERERYNKDFNNGKAARWYNFSRY